MIKRAAEAQNDFTSAPRHRHPQFADCASEVSSRRADSDRRPLPHRLKSRNRSAHRVDLGTARERGAPRLRGEILGDRRREDSSSSCAAITAPAGESTPDSSVAPSQIGSAPASTARASASGSAVSQRRAWRRNPATSTHGQPRSQPRILFVSARASHATGSLLDDLRGALGIAPSIGRRYQGPLDSQSVPGRTLPIMA